MAPLKVKGIVYKKDFYDNLQGKLFDDVMRDPARVDWDGCAPVIDAGGRIVDYVILDRYGRDAATNGKINGEWDFEKCPHMPAFMLRRA